MPFMGKMTPIISATTSWDEWVHDNWKVIGEPCFPSTLFSQAHLEKQMPYKDGWSKVKCIGCFLEYFLVTFLYIYIDVLHNIFDYI